MDVVRAILIAAEISQPSIDGDYPVDVVAYHVKIMDQAGLIHATHNPGGASGSRVSASYCLMDLSWQGHELLSAMRDDSLWSKAKKVVMAEGKSWTIEVLKAWLIEMAKQKLRISVP